jgi:transcriptional/translational regulatory protein YebC/TACO1
MSGHSKWSTIKRQKGAADVKKGVVFTKMTREIMLAAREGGPNPEANFRLRLAVDRARTVNMPHANIDRAIERATGGGDGAQIFEQKGIIEIDAAGRSTDDVQLVAIDAGAEDVEVDGSLIVVYTASSAFEKVKKAIEAAGIPIASAEISMRPSNTVRLEGDRAQQVLRLVEGLEELDDVQKVHANFDIPVEVLQHA